MRTELLVVGCILVAVGIALCVFGYQETQPTTSDQVVGFLEDISGERAPDDLKSPKAKGYALLTLGGLTFAGGIALILRSGNQERKGDAQ